VRMAARMLAGVSSGRAEFHISLKYKVRCESRYGAASIPHTAGQPYRSRPH
jgi:hypothetical protein